DPMLSGAGVDVDCPAGALLTGKSVTCTASYVVTQADVDTGIVRNVATASAAPPAGPRVDSAPDDAEVPADAADGLSLLKTGTLADADHDGLADVGETVDYAFGVT